MQQFQKAIDEAVEKCGGQNALARAIQMRKSHMSEARAGKRGFTLEQLQEIARIAGMEATELYMLQAQFRAALKLQEKLAKNPFTAALHSIAAAFLCVVLSLVQNDANAVSIGDNVVSARLTDCTLSTLYVT